MINFMRCADTILLCLLRVHVKQSCSVYPAAAPSISGGDTFHYDNLGRLKWPNAHSRQIMS